ncbi:hypothetical protein GCM10023335_59870 [Streptomyces siamensis]|uniref:Uncharacterized protein n=1 Tax=Streptomyces siamensis TaxID=1274986 RepID=A0ABP9J9Y1_9ACTN
MESVRLFIMVVASDSAGSPRSQRDVHRPRSASLNPTAHALLPREGTVLDDGPAKSPPGHRTAYIVKSPDPPPPHRPPPRGARTSFTDPPFSTLTRREITSDTDW